MAALAALAVAVDLPQGEEPRDADAPERMSEERDAREDTVMCLDSPRLRRNSSGVSSNRPSRPRTAAKKPTKLLDRFTYAVSSSWRNQISVKVEHSTSRNHLALERTFLGYLRTSLALSMMGITVAQLFRLQHTPTPSPTFGFYILGKPLSCICQGAAISTLVIGAFRTWRIQNAMVRGKAITGGCEIVCLVIGVFLILLLFFVLMIAVDVTKEDLSSG